MTKLEKNIREDYGNILSEDEIKEAIKKLERYADK